MSPLRHRWAPLFWEIMNQKVLDRKVGFPEHLRYNGGGEGKTSAGMLFPVGLGGLFQLRHDVLKFSKEETIQTARSESRDH